MKGFFAKFEGLVPSRRDEPKDWPSFADSIEVSVELDKEIFSELNKKLTSNILLSYGSEGEKRLKKFPEYKMTQSIESILKDVPDKNKFYLTQLHDTFNQLSRLKMEFEEAIENDTSDEFRKISEITCPKVQKVRKNLTKSVQNLNNANEKVKSCESNVKSSAQQNSAVISDIDPSMKSAIELANADIVGKYKVALNAREDAEKEVATLRDQSLLELFTYEADKFNREAIFLRYFQTFAKYLQDCAREVEKRIPLVEDHLRLIKDSTLFGVNLENIVGDNKYSYVIQRVCEIFSEFDFYKEDAALDIRRDYDELVQNCGPYAVADSLKQYLRQLPEPLLTRQLNSEWIEAANSQNIETYKIVLERLPEVYLDNLKLLIELLVNVYDQCSVNKMSASNLGIVFGPNLFRPSEANEQQSYTSNSNQGAVIVQFLIENAQELFGISPRGCLVRDQRCNRKNDSTKIFPLTNSPLPNTTTPTNNSNNKTTNYQEASSSSPLATNANNNKASPPVPPQKPKFLLNSANNSNKNCSGWKSTLFDDLAVDSNHVPPSSDLSNGNDDDNKLPSTSMLCTDLERMSTTSPSSSAFNRSCLDNPLPKLPNNCLMMNNVSPSDSTLKRRKSRPPPPPVPYSTNLHDEKVFPIDNDNKEEQQDRWFIPVTKPDHEFPCLPTNCN